MKNYVIVTGASSGIGEAIAKDLCVNGFTVFACARKTEDLARLSGAGKGIIPVQLDVTNEEQVHRAVNLISDRMNDEAGTFHLINNAGIVSPGPLESIPLNELRQQFEVNVFGLLGVTQAFLPLIKKSKGRIIMMSSVSGSLVTPFLGAYCSSKFALEAIADALRMELHGTGVKVLVVQPGPVATPIWEKNISRKNEIIAALSEETKNEYESRISNFIENTRKELSSALPVESVTKVVRELLLNPKPEARRRVLPPILKFLMPLVLALPESIRDVQLQKKYM